MNVFRFSNQQLACLAIVLGAELHRLEQDNPEALLDPQSYAFQVKKLHRLVLSTVPAPPDDSTIDSVDAEIDLITESSLDYFDRYIAGDR